MNEPRKVLQRFTKWDFLKEVAKVLFKEFRKERTWWTAFPRFTLALASLTPAFVGDVIERRAEGITTTQNHSSVHRWTPANGLGA